MSAIKAGMSRTIARNDLRQDDVMEQRQVAHTWRTREDPLEAVWPQALAMLGQAPELEAKALFEHLAQCHPGGIKGGLLRTFQRRVRSWRLAEGPEKEVFFTQDHKPGEMLAVDWTDLGGLGIMIEGKALRPCRLLRQQKRKLQGRTPLIDGAVVSDARVTASGTPGEPQSIRFSLGTRFFTDANDPQTSVAIDNIRVTNGFAVPETTFAANFALAAILALSVRRRLP